MEHCLYFITWDLVAKHEGANTSLTFVEVFGAVLEPQKDTDAIKIYTAFP